MFIIPMLDEDTELRFAHQCSAAQIQVNEAGTRISQSWRAGCLGSAI